MTRKSTLFRLLAITMLLGLVGTVAAAVDCKIGCNDQILAIERTDTTGCFCFEKKTCPNFFADSSVNSTAANVRGPHCAEKPTKGSYKAYNCDGMCTKKCTTELATKHDEKTPPTMLPTMPITTNTVSDCSGPY